MTVKITIPGLLFLFWIIACKHLPEKVIFQTVNLNGKYQFDEEPDDHFANNSDNAPRKKRRVIRDWFRKYWELTIKEDKGELEFTENDRGLESFSLSVNFSNEGENIKVYRFRDLVRLCCRPSFFKTW
jgi:hypothetical protein